MMNLQFASKSTEYISAAIVRESTYYGLLHLSQEFVTLAK